MLSLALLLVACTGAQTASSEGGTDTATDGSVDNGECPGPDTQSTASACERFTGTAACPFVADSRWTSVRELECGLSPGCPSLCYWSIDVTADEWSWSLSDFGERGTWSCDPEMLAEGRDRAIPWSFDEATCILTWDEATYILTE